MRCAAGERALFTSNAECGTARQAAQGNGIMNNNDGRWAMDDGRWAIDDESSVRVSVSFSFSFSCSRWQAMGGRGGRGRGVVSLGTGHGGKFNGIGSNGIIAMV